MTESIRSSVSEKLKFRLKKNKSMFDLKYSSFKGNSGFFIEQIIFPFIYFGTKIIAISKTTKEDLKKLVLKINKLKLFIVE